MSCINCYITIHPNQLPEKDQLGHLLQQRQELLEYLETSITEVNKFFMPSAQKPIAHLECPFDHEQNCPPHLKLNIKEKSLLICQCNKRRIAEIVPEVCYIQLFEPTHILCQKSKFNNKCLL